jgi:hypothetical protein
MDDGRYFERSGHLVQVVDDGDTTGFQMKYDFSAVGYYGDNLSDVELGYENLNDDAMDELLSRDHLHLCHKDDHGLIPPFYSYFDSSCHSEGNRGVAPTGQFWDKHTGRFEDIPSNRQELDALFERENVRNKKTEQGNCKKMNRKWMTSAQHNERAYMEYLDNEAEFRNAHPKTHSASSNRNLQFLSLPEDWRPDSIEFVDRLSPLLQRQRDWYVIPEQSRTAIPPTSSHYRRIGDTRMFIHDKCLGFWRFQVRFKYNYDTDYEHLIQGDEVRENGWCYLPVFENGRGYFEYNVPAQMVDSFTNENGDLCKPSICWKSGSGYRASVACSVIRAFHTGDGTIELFANGIDNSDGFLDGRHPRHNEEAPGNQKWSSHHTTLQKRDNRAKTLCQTLMVENSALQLPRDYVCHECNCRGTYQQFQDDANFHHKEGAFPSNKSCRC